jgi:hypothetical protein
MNVRLQFTRKKREALGTPCLVVGICWLIEKWVTQITDLSAERFQ